MPLRRHTQDELRGVIETFFEVKKKNELQIRERAETLRQIYLKEGVEIIPEDAEEILEEISHFKSADSRDDNRKTICSRRTSSLDQIPNYHRGLQSFDLALNPNVQEIINTANCSLRNDPTSQIKQGTASKLKGKRKSTLGTITTSHTSTWEARLIYPSYRSSVKVGESGYSYSTLDSPSVSFSGDLPPVIQKFVFQSVIDQQMKLMTANNTTDLPWLLDRIEASSRSCRFSIPMDVLEFRSMTPIEYLEKFCKVCKEQQVYFKKCFEKKIDKTLGKKVRLITEGERLIEALSDVLLTPVEKHDIVDFLKLVHLNVNHLNKTPISLNTFSLIATLAERILCVSLANIPLLDKYHDPRDFLERADFSGLATKLRGVQFQHSKLVKLLFSLS